MKKIITFLVVSGFLLAILSCGSKSGKETESVDGDSLPDNGEWTADSDSDVTDDSEPESSEPEEQEEPESHCDPNPCTDMQNSTGICKKADKNNFICECKEGFHWLRPFGCTDRKPSFADICTGQTECFGNEGKIECPESWDVFGSQDAYYAKLGFCVPQSFSIAGTGNETTVTDNNLGLEWQQNVPNNVYSWENALKYCDELVYAGHDDWRLPSVPELASTVNVKDNIILDRNYFHVPKDNYTFWSNTYYNPGSMLEGGIVLASDGSFTYIHVDEIVSSPAAYVRCVRNTPIYSYSSEIKSFGGDEVAVSRGTNRMWTKKYASSKDWKDALLYCEHLDYAGFSDWRLPNRNELFSIRMSQFYLNDTNTSYYYDPFWSSTTVESNGSQAWMADFDTYLFQRNKMVKDSTAILCVRNILSDSETGLETASAACKQDYCKGIEHSTGECAAIKDSGYFCVCENGFAWDVNNKKCTEIPRVFGRICTGITECTNEAGSTKCPEKGEPFYGQDAQYAELGFCIPQSFSINGTDDEEKTVIDNSTGLEWQQTIAGEVLSVEENKNYCENLEYAGFSDWRIPKATEMFALLDLSQGEFLIDLEYFPADFDIQTKEFITLSHSGYTIFALGFRRGIYYFAIEERKCAVRCVRGELSPEQSFTTLVSANGDEFVLDNKTKLMWQRYYLDNVTLEDAFNYCENLTHAGFSDWRLPNASEILSLENFDGKNPEQYWDIAPYSFWSSSENIQSSVDSLSKEPWTRRVRCVRQ